MCALRQRNVFRMKHESVHAERRRELGRFLRNRRARLLPENVGVLPSIGRRRVAGLRREEVAVLAGVSVKWYTMLESGIAEGVSSTTLDAVARALLLTPDEVEYIHNLADSSIDEASDGDVSRLMFGAFAAIEWAPAYICTSQWTVLHWNRAMSLVWGIEPPGGPAFNIVRRMFLDERLRSQHGDRFGEFGRRLIAMMRVGAARLIDDPVYNGLFVDLQNDPIFAAAWDAYDIAAPFGTSRSQIDSINIGTFTYEAVSLHVEGVVGHSIVVQVPDPPSQERLADALAVTTHE